MALSEPRGGEVLGFSLYPRSSDEITLGNPETIIWSSINYLCSRSGASWLASDVYGISSKRDRDAVAWNLRLYIQQASEFYHAAANAKPNTAPLIYYYSFLNLAKAICELRYPRFHQSKECYAHGLSWKPHPEKLVDVRNERISIRGRGVWHALWESLARAPCPAIDPTHLEVKRLFSFCPEICAEFGRLFAGPRPLVELVHPAVLFDKRTNEAWLRFSVFREELKDLNLSAPAFIAQVRPARCGYVEVESKGKELRTFQSETAKVRAKGETPWSTLAGDVSGFNGVGFLGRNGRLSYYFPLQTCFPFRMPQLLVSYTVLFWLGSLVRYDPHSVHELMDSDVWILIDGFMTQSRLWLLELFEWSFYQTETTLAMAR